MSNHEGTIYQLANKYLPPNVDSAISTTSGYTREYSTNDNSNDTQKSHSWSKHLDHWGRLKTYHSHMEGMNINLTAMVLIKLTKLDADAMPAEGWSQSGCCGPEHWKD